MKKSALVIPVLALLAACTGKDSYTVSITMPEDVVGKTAYIMNSETGQNIDSTEIKSADVVFKGKIKEPILAMVVVGGYPYAQFVLEPGNLNMTDEGLATGTPSNDAFVAYNDSITPLVAALSGSISEEESQDIFMNQLVPGAVDFIVNNPENPFSLPVFGQVAMYLDADQIVKVISAAPKLAADPDVQRTLEMARAKANTSAGQKYVDVTAEYDGKTQSLSEFVKPGQWTIIDFWASWCGPCKREVPGIKALYDKYHSKGLNVVGVAVRDKPEDTLAAMEQLGITWPVILNGGADVLETYGIMGIPCIMLVNPEGVIVARDLFGQQLTDAVTEAMESEAQ